MVSGILAILCSIAFVALFIFTVVKIAELDASLWLKNVLVIVSFFGTLLLALIPVALAEMLF